MTHAPTAVHVLRLPLLAAAALVLALGIASPATAFVDDAAAEETAQNDGFEAIGDGFVDPGTTTEATEGHDRGHSEGVPTAPTGGVDAGFGGMAADAGGFGALHAVAAGLLALVGLGLAAHRRRVLVGSA